MQCERCRDLLLDFLYDLLDPAEAGEVESHLSTCPACAAARNGASHDQALLASAAKASFPQVTFTPPTEPVLATVTTAPNSASPLPAQPRQRSWFAMSSLLGWGVAASLLIAIPTVPALLRQTETRTATAMATAGVALTSRNEAQARLQSAEAELARSESQTKQTASPTPWKARGLEEAAKSQTDAVLAQWWEKQKAIVFEEKRKKLGVEVIGPAAIQPGAPNDYTIVLDDRQDSKGLKQIEAQVRDEKDRVLFRQPLNHERSLGRHQIKLPASLWNDVKPSSDLFIVVATVDPKTDLRTSVQEKVRLLGPVYTTMLTTDKPLYRPGERVFFRSLTLDRTSFLPPGREQELKFELRDPQGNPVPGLSLIGSTNLVHETTASQEPLRGPDGQIVRGIGCGEFELPATLAPGDYTLSVREMRHPAGYVPAAPAFRRISVRPFNTDRFQKKLEFGAASFQGGDQVHAWCEVRDLGMPVAGAVVTPTLTADGTFKTLPPIQTGPDGRAAIQFDLPTMLERGDAKLQAEVRHGDTTESLTRRVPTIGRAISIEFFPEGGNLVAGVPCRVYVRATSPMGEPVDVRGEITDGREVVGRVETFTDAKHPGANRGLGAFTFTPKIGTSYWLKLDKPVGIHEPMRLGTIPTVPAAVASPAAIVASRTGFLLPKASESGVVMWVPEGVTAPGKPVVVQLWSVGKTRKLVVGAYTRGRLMETKSVTVKPGTPTVVHLAGDTNPRGGVTRVTVFEEPPSNARNGDLMPLAERLVYRAPVESLKLAFQPRTANGEDTNALQSDATNQLTIRATDESSRPTAAILYTAVVDANAVAMAEGKLERMLPAHFLLAGEVQKPDDLEHVDFLLSETPQAAQALDLLLGTQGWRRFAEQDAGTMRRKRTIGSPDLDRLVMLSGRLQTDVATFTDLRKQKAFEEFRSKYEAATRPVEAKVAPPVLPNPEPALTPLREAVCERQAEYESRATLAAAEAARTESTRQMTRTGLWIAGAVSLGLLIASLRTRTGAKRLPLAVAAVAGGVLTAVLAFSIPTTLPTVASSPMDASPAANATQETLVTKTSVPGTEKASEPLSAPALQSQIPSKDLLTTKDVRAGEKEQVANALPPQVRPKELNSFKASAAGNPTTSMSSPAGAKAGITPIPKPQGPSSRVMAPMSPSAATIPEPSAAPAMTAGGGGLVSPMPLPTIISPEKRFGITGALMPPNAPSGMARPGLERPSSLPKNLAVPGTSNGFTQDRTDKFLRDGKGEHNPYIAADRPRRAESEALQAGRQANTLREQTPAKKPATVALGGMTATDAAGQIESQSNLGQMRKAGTAESDKDPLRQLSEKIDRALANRGTGPGAGGYLDARQAFEILLQVPPLVIREYAPLTTSRPTGEGSDEVVSLDTILWHPLIVLPQDGTITLPLRANSDSTGYEILVAGHTLNGRLGSVRGTVPVVTPPTK